MFRRKNGWWASQLRWLARLDSSAANQGAYCRNTSEAKRPRDHNQWAKHNYSRHGGWRHQARWEAWEASKAAVAA